MPAIAILDDDEDLRTLLAEMFERVLGLPCVSAGGVSQLVDQAQDVLSTRMVLIDINLGPGVPTGFDAYGWLRSNGYPGRIVFLTGHAHNHPLVKQALAFKDVEVLEKPVSADRLIELVHSGGLLERHDA